MQITDVKCDYCLMDATCKPFTKVDGVGCNYCVGKAEKIKLLKSRNFGAIVSEIKETGRKNEFDCVIGVSGGVDSSYVVHLAKSYGLRPLAVHMDNGWNTELSSKNIKRILNANKVPLITKVIDWEEFRNLQLAFMKANVIDLELLTDNALYGTCYEIAKKHKIKYILGGQNIATEGIQMPENWNWHNKYDGTNIRAIARKYSVKLKTFPLITLVNLIMYSVLNKIKWVDPLNMINFSKNEALSTLTNEYGYVPYDRKHGESFFTNFYQNVILPEKFNVDKRKLHLSDLIISGELSREEAVRKLNQGFFNSNNERQEEVNYFVKKMKITNSEFEQYIMDSPVEHAVYRNEKKLWDCVRLLNRAKKRIQ